MDWAEHEGGWWLLPFGKTAPIKVGQDGAIRGIGIKVRFEQVGVHEGQYNA